MHDALLTHISKVAWDDKIPETRRLEQIQGLLYQHEQNQDKHTERMYGDDDSHPYPNMRRC